MLSEPVGDEVFDYNPSDTPSPVRGYRPRLTNEEQLYIWCLALQSKIVGRVSGPSKPVHYALLVDRGLATDEINRVSDLDPITEDQLRTIVSRFESLEPPYRSRP